MEENREYRMYCLVMYNISTMQKGVQAAHACLEYANHFHNEEDFKQYVEKDKTMIILDGGTSDDMLNIKQLLSNNYIKHASFIEPDLNKAMSAICFLADERVWNRKEYPDFDESMDMGNVFMMFVQPEKIAAENEKRLGGSQNVVLRNLIKNKPLAR